MARSTRVAPRLGSLAILALFLEMASGYDLSEAPTPQWRGDFLARVEILALLKTLDAELLSQDSATLTLERWCATHRLATPAAIKAVRVASPDKPASPAQRQELRVGPEEKLGFRHVVLSCGAVILSEADNWYVPSRLQPDMNATLEKTDTPFGKVVLPLRFRRHTLSSRMLWSPLPEHWEMNAIPTHLASERLRIPESLLQHRALLTLPDGTPISAVIETYKSGLLAFPSPN